jgi:hypothetical protein
MSKKKSAPATDETLPADATAVETTGATPPADELSALKKMTMAELVDKYNSMVPEAEAKTEKQLGTLTKARNAIKKLLGVSFNHERSPRSGIGKFAKDLIREGHTNAAVLAAVKAEYPDAKTTMGCIGYYRAKVKLEGAKVSAEATTDNNDEVVETETETAEA